MKNEKWYLSGFSAIDNIDYSLWKATEHKKA